MVCICYTCQPRTTQHQVLWHWHLLWRCMCNWPAAMRSLKAERRLGADKRHPGQIGGNQCRHRITDVPCLEAGVARTTADRPSRLPSTETAWHGKPAVTTSIRKFFRTGDFARSATSVKHRSSCMPYLSCRNCTPKAHIHSGRGCGWKDKHDRDDLPGQYLLSAPAASLVKTARGLTLRVACKRWRHMIMRAGVAP